MSVYRTQPMLASGHNDVAHQASFAPSGNLLLAAAVQVAQLLMVQAKEMEQRGLEIVGCDDIRRRAVAEFVGFAVRDAWLESAASYPDAEALAVVIAA